MCSEKHKVEYFLNDNTSQTITSHSRVISETLKCVNCDVVYSPSIMILENNLVRILFKCPNCGFNKDFTKTTYIDENGYIPLVVSN